MRTENKRYTMDKRDRTKEIKESTIKKKPPMGSLRFLIDLILPAARLHLCIAEERGNSHDVIPVTVLWRDITDPASCAYIFYISRTLELFCSHKRTKRSAVFVLT